MKDKMVKVPVAELEGAALNWVAKSLLGAHPQRDGYELGVVEHIALSAIRNGLRITGWHATALRGYVERQRGAKVSVPASVLADKSANDAPATIPERFNKANVLAAFERRAAELQKQYGFDANNGTAQLKGKLASQDATVAYGMFRLYHDLVQQVDDGSLLRR